MSSGPLAAAATEVGLRIGQRVWPNLWKQTIDSLGPVLGLTRPDREFHPRDGRIVRLGIHRTDDPPLAFDVEVGIWWRPATLDSGSEVPVTPQSARAAPIASDAARARESSARRPVVGTDGIVIFENDDDGYRRWIVFNPSGYVVNTTRSMSTSYLILHRATCQHVSELRPGYQTWTCGSYIKVCALQRSALEKWARDLGGRLKATCNCNP